MLNRCPRSIRPQDEIGQASVDECLIDELLQDRTDRVGARWEELGEEQHDDLLGWVDPERSACRPTPRIRSGGSDHLVLGAVELDRESEAEAHAGELGFGKQRTTERFEFGATRQVIARHVVDGAAPQDAGAIEFAAIEQHVANRR